MKDPKKENSAGLLMWDIIDGVPKVLLCHPGGPYFWKKDAKAWTIPKGLIEAEDGEGIFHAACREFEEETDIKPISNSRTDYWYLSTVTYKSGKVIWAWAFRGKFPGKIKSNTFEMEWPPKSGKIVKFPECDRGQMFTLAEAREKILVSQEPFLDRLQLFLETNLYL